MRYLEKQVNAEDSILIVDDVFDTGLSVKQVIIDLKRHCRKNTPEIRIATPYFKPANNRTDISPEYYIEESNKWLVFPHELDGLSDTEILEHKAMDQHIKKRMLGLKI